MRRVHCPTMPTEAKSADNDAWQSQDDYWYDGATYIATPAEAAEIDKAIETLNVCYARAMDYVVASSERLARIKFSSNAPFDHILRAAAAKSWKDETNRTYIIDRYDFAWNGGTPKLLERNFGYLGLIACTGVAQEQFAAWLRAQPGYEDVRTVGDLKAQFIAAFREAATDRRLGAGNNVTISVCGPERGNNENYDPCVHYAESLLSQWITEAGFSTTSRILGVDRMGYLDLDDCSRIVRNTKGGLFPFAGLDPLIFAQATETSSAVPLIPAWTILAGHKGMLPVLAQLFPDCPYILPARTGNQPLPNMASIIKFSKGCQGEEARIHDAKGKLIHDHRGLKPMQDAHYDASNFIAQALASETQNPDGSNKVLHVFSTNGRVAAAGFREAPGAIVGGGKATKTQYVPLLIRDRDDDAPAAYLRDDPLPQRAKARLSDWFAYCVGLSQFKP